MLKTTTVLGFGVAVTTEVAGFGVGESVVTGALLVGLEGACDCESSDVVALSACLFATMTMLEACTGFSQWIASAAFLSPSKLPCLNFLGLKLCNAACNAGGSTWSNSRWKA